MHLFRPMSTVRHKLGKTIRRLRTDAGYSQEGFADACKLHRTYIEAMERGEKNLTTDSLERIAKTLKLSILSFSERLNANSRDSSALPSPALVLRTFLAGFRMK